MMRAYLVAGLGFGDEGKGSIVDYLCRITGARLVVRYNGGPQAAHNVVTPDGLHHTFAQFGSGTLAGAKTHLSRFMMVEPYALRREAAILWRAGILNLDEMLTVDENCIIITPWHWLANRIKELARGRHKHGSCGLGIGEAKRDFLRGYFLRVGDLKYGSSGILKSIRKKKLEECELFRNLSREIDELYDDMCGADPDTISADYYMWAAQLNIVPANYLSSLNQDMVFEGAQGVLLDETYGFAPRNTWSDCTFNNADALLADSLLERIKIGVLRPYMTRHGAGAFPTECKDLLYLDKYNKNGRWQGAFRFGHFDTMLYNYALKCLGGVDILALTHAEEADRAWAYCDAYLEYSRELSTHYRLTDGELSQRLPHYTVEGCFSLAKVEELLKTDIGLISRGDTYLDKSFLTWRSRQCKSSSNTH